MAFRDMKLDQVIEFLGESSLRYEYDCLREIEAWARGQQPFHEGDEVTIADDLNIERSSGWYSNRDCLVKGSTGTVESIGFSKGTWFARFLPDVEWSTDEWSPGDIHVSVVEHDRRHTYALKMSHLRPRTVDDIPLTVPTAYDHRARYTPSQVTTAICTECERPIRRTPGGAWVHDEVGESNA